MAVVKTEKVYSTGKEFVRKVKFSQRHGFTCDYPAEVGQAIGKWKATADTLEGCIKEWEQTIDEWQKRRTTTRDVILYKVERNMYRSAPHAGNHDDIRVTHDYGDVHSAVGIGMMVSAAVFKETRTQLIDRENIEYEWIRDRLPDSIEHKCGHRWHDPERDGYTILEWTQELEDFFKSIALGMEKLIIMFDELQDPKKVIAFAEQGRKLLDSGPPADAPSPGQD